MFNCFFPLYIIKIDYLHTILYIRIFWFHGHNLHIDYSHYILSFGHQVKSNHLKIIFLKQERNKAQLQLDFGTSCQESKLITHFEKHPTMLRRTRAGQLTVQIGWQTNLHAKIKNQCIPPHLMTNLPTAALGL